MLCCIEETVKRPRPAALKRKLSQALKSCKIRRGQGITLLNESPEHAICCYTTVNAVLLKFEASIREAFPF
jgi:hypothetical protein